MKIQENFGSKNEKQCPTGKRLSEVHCTYCRCQPDDRSAALSPRQVNSSTLHNFQISPRLLQVLFKFSKCLVLSA